MNVHYPYRAVISGEEHIVQGWRGRELLTDKGGFFVGHIYGNWQIQTCRIFEVAMLQSDGKGGWLVNGKSFSSIKSLPMGARMGDIPNNENLRVYKEKICAVAWYQTQNSSSVTELLDLILKFWKLTPQPSNGDKYKNKDWQGLLTDFAAAFHELSTYQRIFAAWGGPAWLTEFRPTGQKIPLSPERKELAKVTAELVDTKAQLRKAESAASDTFKEAMSKWFRFAPQGMSADTAARIAKAVQMYSTNPKKRSLAKIAAEFRVSRKTVSVWFEKFRKETGFQVILFRCHESVKEHLEADSKQEGEK